MITESFVRWAGGKSWLVPYIKKLIAPIQINHYHEPFLGGAATFFALDLPRRSYLSDVNDDLINAYLQIKESPEAVIQHLDGFQSTKDEYYRIRSLHLTNNIERAAQFIFLNQTSYNGLYRVNRKGEYNVPYGNRGEWRYDADRIRRCSKKLYNTRIVCGDFEINKYRIKQNDLVFLDPPYTVSHNNNGFIEYNKNLFSIEDQKRLSLFIDFIKRRGAFYILTNANHEAIQMIFQKGDRKVILERNSLIGGKEAKRGKTSELIFTNIR